MSAKEKSDLPEVAGKRANKAASAAAEPVERRGGAKENAELQSTVRTQSREAVTQAQARIRGAVTRNEKENLAQSETLCTWGSSLHGTWEVSPVPGLVPGRLGKAIAARRACTRMRSRMRP